MEGRGGYLGSESAGGKKGKLKEALRRENQAADGVVRTRRGRIT